MIFKAIKHLILLKISTMNPPFRFIGLPSRILIKKKELNQTPENIIKYNITSLDLGVTV